MCLKKKILYIKDLKKHVTTVTNRMRALIVLNNPVTKSKTKMLQTKSEQACSSSCEP